MNDLQHEIRTLQKLGFKPEYHRGLTNQDLLTRNQPAILHVKENISSRRIPHAVALLSVESEKKIFEIANPLYGKQLKSIEDMEGYWYGEAIFVSNSQ